MLRNKFVLLLAVCAAYCASAQDLRQDLRLIAGTVDSAKSVSVNAKVEVRARKGAAVMYKMETVLKRSGETSYTVMGDQEFYVNREYSMSVDNDEKKITILKKEKQKGSDKISRSVDLKALQELLKEEGREDKSVVKLLSDENGVRSYSVTNVPEIKEVRISLDVNRKCVVAFSYEYRDDSEYKGQYIAVTYTRFDCQTDVSGNLAQANFFTVSNGKAVVNPRFKNYTLHTEL